MSSINENKVEYSIIILVWNKEYEINLVLQSLACQDFDTSRFEVVIVDDGSDTSLKHIVDKYKNTIEIRYFRLNHTGIRGTNRNYGATQSRGDKLVFLDGDMIISPHVISEFDRTIGNDRNKAVLGVRTELFEYEKSFINEKTISDQFEIIENLPGQDDERLSLLPYMTDGVNSPQWQWNLFYSHSICLWKEEFIAVGGFDPVFSEHWGAEDIELGYRLVKNGCDLILNPRARSYHLYHSSDFLEKEQELVTNYQLFLQKHPCWDVEVFIKEVEVDYKYKNSMYRLVQERPFVIENIDDASRLLDSLPAHTVLFGIEDPVLLNSEKIDIAFSPRSNNQNKKIRNMFGISTQLEDQTISCALVSRLYETANTGVYRHLLVEAARIAKTVCIVDEKTPGTGSKMNQAPALIHKQIARSKYILFNMPGNVNTLERYYYEHLAIAAKHVGLHCALFNPMYSAKSDRETGSGASSSYNGEILEKLSLHHMETLFEEIPSFVSPALINFNRFPVENRILWTDQNYINENILRVKNTLPFYGLFLNAHGDKCYSGQQGKCKENVLLYGVDSKKIKRITGEKTDMRRSGKFTFLWADLFTDIHSGLEIVLDVFNEIFSGNFDVCIKIINGNNLFSSYDSRLFNKAFLSQVNCHYQKNRTEIEQTLLRAKKRYACMDNIVFMDGLDNDDFLTEQLLNSDCLINVNSHISINPLVLESVAMAKRAIVIYENRYENYFERDMCFPVSGKRSVVGLDAVIRNIADPSGDYSRYLMVHSPVRESLRENMMKAFSERNSINIEQNRIQNYIKDTDWIQRALDLMSILRENYD